MSALALAVRLTGATPFRSLVLAAKEFAGRGHRPLAETALSGPLLADVAHFLARYQCVTPGTLCAKKTNSSR